MKKLLCVFLAILMVAFACVPAGATTLVSDALPAADLAEGSGTQYRISFRQPSDEYKGGYKFVETDNGEYVFELDDSDMDPKWKYENDYLYDSYYETFVRANEVLSSQFPENPVYYRVKEMPSALMVNAEDIITFKVITSEKYNPTTVVVKANGYIVEPSIKGEYAVYANGDIEIVVVERNAANEEVLLRSHFFVYLPKGEEGEYRCRTLADENYSVVF